VPDGLGLDYFGYRTVVLGDLKPDYAELVAPWAATW
jgi:hypothetical protein